MKMGDAVLITLGSVLLVGILAVQAQGLVNKNTTITFSHPVQVPGQTLPAGTYTFTSPVSTGTRSVVEIWDKDHTNLIAKVLTIQSSRFKGADGTVIEFHETSAGTPPALKAWFYHGEPSGRGFVYPKQVAVQLAQANNEDVPAEKVEPTPSTLETVPLEAVTPQGKEEPLDQAFPPEAAK